MVALPKLYVIHEVPHLNDGPNLFLEFKTLFSGVSIVLMIYAIFVMVPPFERIFEGFRTLEIGVRLLTL